MLKIFLFGWFGENNLGDNLLLEQTIDLIEKINSNSNITIYSNNILENDYCDSSNIKLETKSMLSYIKALFKYDIYIFGPGGLFPNNDLIKLVFIYFYVTILKFMRKKVIFFALGIEECNFNNVISNKIITKTLKKASSCTLRYDYTMYKCEQLKNCIISSDLIFTKNFKILKTKSNKKYVLLALANIFNNYSQKDEFILSIIPVLKKVIDDGYELHFLTFNKKYDESLNKETIKKLGIYNKCKIIEFTNNINVITNEYLKASFIIGMRYHSLVIALNLNIPFIPISYSSKTEELLYDFQLTDLSAKICYEKKKYFCKIIKLQTKKLFEDYNFIINNYSYIKSLIAKQLIVEKQKAKYNIDILNKYIRKEN